VTGLSDRELASLAWIGLIAVGVLVWRPLRPVAGSLRDLVRLFLSPVLVIPATLLGIYSAAVVALMSQTPAWTVDLLKDTAIWFLGVGVVLLFGATRAVDEPGWFRHRARELVGAVVVLEFYLNLHTLPLPLEFLLQGWAIVLILVAAAATLDRESAGMSTAAERLQVATGLALLAYVGLWLAGSWRTLDLAQTAREFALPIWLTLFAFPFLAVWSWFLVWDGARRQVAMFSPEGRASWRSHVAVVWGYGRQTSGLRRLANYWARRVAEAPSVQAKLAVIREHRAELRAREVETRKRAEDLARYAGVKGTDADSHQLDRREFAATRQALTWLATCQSGWYQRQPPVGRYKHDLLKIFQPGSTHGLPDEHGITMKVRRDGGAWYAWRRTITGWAFAVGAAGPPPEQWFYDGAEPPNGYPGSDPRWGHSPFEQGPNWED